jgi:hypothetical protein
MGYEQQERLLFLLHLCGRKISYARFATDGKFLEAQAPVLCSAAASPSASLPVALVAGSTVAGTG